LSKPNIFNPGFSKYTQITYVGFNVPAGGAGWVDTDVSAVTGTDTHKVWVVVAFSSITDKNVGIRPHGSALTPSMWASKSTTLLTTVDSTGHADLLRDAAASIDYGFIGYFR